MYAGLETRSKESDSIDSDNSSYLSKKRVVSDSEPDSESEDVTVSYYKMKQRELEEDPEILIVDEPAPLDLTSKNGKDDGFVRDRRSSQSKSTASGTSHQSLKASQIGNEPVEHGRGTKGESIDQVHGSPKQADEKVPKKETGKQSSKEEQALEALYPPITTRQQREQYASDFLVAYQPYLNLYNRLRPHAVEIVSIRQQLRTLPTTALRDDIRRRDLTETLKRKYAELGYGNERNKKPREEFQRLVKKVRLIKKRVKEFDAAMNPSRPPTRDIPSPLPQDSNVKSKSDRSTPLPQDNDDKSKSDCSIIHEVTTVVID